MKLLRASLFVAPALAGSEKLPAEAGATSPIRRCFLFIACLPASAFAADLADWAPNITTAATWNSNATNAGRSSDVISALELRADASATHRFSVGYHDALFIGANLTAEAWPRFDGLDHSSLGPRLAWQHKFGLGAFVPTFTAELSSDAVFARESDRSGLTGGVTFALRQRLDPATRVSLTHERARHDARALVFERTGHETALELARDLDESWSLTLAARWREGDVLSYATPPRPDLVALAKVRVPNTTFDRPFVAYSLDAHSLTSSLALSYALDPVTSLTFGYEYRETTRQPLRYVNHLVSAALAHQF